jgi:hypothetical protein
MHALIDDDRLILTASARDCAALWVDDASVCLDVGHPTVLAIYTARWPRLPWDILLAGHLDFRDAAGHTWVELYDWTCPPFPQRTHPGVLERWEQALACTTLTWWSSLDHPRFAWLHATNPLLLR